VTSERFCYLHVTDQYTLHQFGGNLRNAFPTAIGILHVGSSVTRPNWRDVDVRIVLPDDEYDQLAAITDPKVLAVALSIWGQQFTRLPIDCQVQRFSDQLPEGHLPRHSIGGLPL
jgi:hypothetical protein